MRPQYHPHDPSWQSYTWKSHLETSNTVDECQRKRRGKSTTNSARKEDGCINTVVITGNIEEAQNNDGWRANGKLSKQSNECAPNSFTSSMIPQYQLDAPAHQSSTWTSHPDPWKREPRNPARILSYPYERHNTSMAQMVVLEFKYDG